jgi:hypothetical protein
MRASRSAALTLVILFAALAGCTGTSSTTTAAAPAIPTVKVSPQRWCSWYTPTIVKGSADGQQVILTATGPGCRSRALIAWVADETGKPWASTSITGGQVIAQLARGGTTVRIIQTGFATATDQTAGYLADAFEAARWRVEAAPVTSGPTPGPLPTPIGP